jgi:hypothetical protein
MPICKPNREPYTISAHFYRALHEDMMRLEANADKDQEFAATLEHPDHLRRQNRLVRAQRERAELLYRFLSGARLREG